MLIKEPTLRENPGKSTPFAKPEVHILRLSHQPFGVVVPLITTEACKKVFLCTADAKLGLLSWVLCESKNKL